MRRDIGDQMCYECEEGVVDHYDEEWEEYEDLVKKERENKQLTKEENEKLGFFRKMMEEAEASANPEC